MVLGRHPGGFCVWNVSSMMKGGREGKSEGRRDGWRDGGNEELFMCTYPPLHLYTAFVNCLNVCRFNQSIDKFVHSFGGRGGKKRERGREGDKECKREGGTEGERWRLKKDKCTFTYAYTHIYIYQICACMCVCCSHDDAPRAERCNMKKCNERGRRKRERKNEV